MLSRLVLAQGKAPQSGSTSTSHISSIKRSNAHKRIPLAPKRLFGTKSTPKTPGMVSLEDLKALAQTRQIDTVAMSFTDHLGRQMGKRCDADFFLEEGVSGSYACNYLLTVDMDSNVLPGFKFSNWYVLPLRHRILFLCSSSLFLTLYSFDRVPGKQDMAISSLCPTSRPCASLLGSTAPSTSHAM